MFVLNLADGTQVVPPVLIQGSSQGQTFSSQMRKQRSALVETNINGVKTVFGCSGTILETGAGADGFCFAFDVATNKLGPCSPRPQGKEPASGWGDRARRQIRKASSIS
jgi:hypothetical protein